MSYIVEGRTVPDHLPPDIDLSLARPLDPSIYEADVEFLSAVTGIKDYEELKEHVLKVQADAYAVFPYPCIRNFAISNSKINTYPGYEDLLKLGKERAGAIYLEIACCVGNDVRRAILDGFPASQIVATDLIPGFWEVGHKLFKSIPESFPVKFLPGDFFDTSFFDPQAEVKGAAPDLSTLTDLTPLRGRISAIHTSSFFHLFDEERQLQVAHLLNALLSPQPGSIAFGAHGGLPEKGERIGSLQLGTTDQPMKMFCHSPETFKEMWETVCGKEKVDIQVTLRDAPDRKDCMWTGNRKRYWLVWSVRRL